MFVVVAVVVAREVGVVAVDKDPVDSFVVDVAGRLIFLTEVSSYYMTQTGEAVDDDKDDYDDDSSGGGLARGCEADDEDGNYEPTMNCLKLGKAMMMRCPPSSMEYSSR